MHESVLVITRRPTNLLERLEPRIKLLCLAIWLAAVLSVGRGDWPLFSYYAALILLIVCAAPRLIPRYATRLAAAAPLILGLALFMPLLRDEPPFVRLGPLLLSRGGIAFAAHFACTAGLCVAGVLLLWVSTPQDLLLQGLRGLGFPAAFVGVLGFMWRYLEVLRPELHRLTDARAARTLGVRGPNRWRSGAGLIGTLFLRAQDRAERVADAMAARGYAGELRTFHRPHFHRRDFVAAGVLALAVAAPRIAWGFV